MYWGILPSPLDAVQSTPHISFPGGARRVARVLALLLRSVGAEATLPICRYSILEMRNPPLTTQHSPRSIVFWKFEIRHRFRFVYLGILPSPLEAVQSTLHICFPGGARRVARVLALLLRSVGAEFTLPICRYSVLEMRNPFSKFRRAEKGEQL